MNLRDATPNASKRILLLGPSGTGKTSFLATMPAPYVADFDNGLTSIMGRDVEADQFHDPDPDNPTAYLEFKKVLKRWRDKPERETFCVDSLTTFSNAIFKWAMKENGRLNQQPSQGDWGKAINEVTKALGAISTLKCNVVMTAHLQVERDELLGSIKYGPLIYGRGLPGSIPIYFDEVYLTTVSAKPGAPAVYRLRMHPDQRYDIIKSGMNRLGCFGVEEDPDFSKLLAKYTKAYDLFLKENK